MRAISVILLAATAATSLAKKLKDDKKFTYKAGGVKYGCTHVAGKPEKRCARKGKSGKKKETAKDACEKTCDKYTCPKFGGKGVPSCVEGSGSGSGSDSESSPGGGFKMDDKTIYKAAKLWFEDEAKAIQKYGDMSTWDTSDVTVMDYLLGACWSDPRCPAPRDAKIPDIGNWNTAKVTSMWNMFRDVQKWDGGNIGDWDVGKVTSFQAMFEGCYKFNADISGWNTKNVRNMKEMLEEATSFNQDISGWNVNKVTAMNFMLMGAKKFNQDLSGWSVGKVTTIKDMLNGAKKFNQKLGWCLDKDVETARAFSGTKCAKNDCDVDFDC